MWKSQREADTRSAEEWSEALSLYCASAETQACARFLFQIASQVAECYLGGDETPFLVQVLAAPSETRKDVDLIATVLTPNAEGAEEVNYCFTARGEEALSLCCSFMESFPDSPVITESSPRVFEHVLCCLESQSPWGKTPVTLSGLKRLQKLGEADDVLKFYLPASSQKKEEVSFERFPPRQVQILD